MYEALVDYLSRHPWLNNLIASVAIVAGALLVRWLLRRSLRVADIPSVELRRQWVIWIRAFTILVILAGLTFVWATQLHTMALSIAAFVVAVVLSLKELIACVTGSFLKIGAQSFSLGDRVTVNGMRGDVIDQTLLATTLMEVGPSPTASQYTGRTISLPNSLFLAHPIVRESPIGGFGLSTITLPAKAEDDLLAAEAMLLEACRDETRGYIEQVRLEADRLTRAEGINPPSIEPRVTWLMADPQRVDLIVRYPAPFENRREVEQRILKRYVAFVKEQLSAKQDAAASAGTDPRA